MVFPILNRIRIISSSITFSSHLALLKQPISFQNQKSATKTLQFAADLNKAFEICKSKSNKTMNQNDALTFSYILTRDNLFDVNVRTK